MNKRAVIFLILLSMCVFSLSLAGEGAPLIPLRSFEKTTDYPIDDNYVEGIDPNVLFLLDTGSPMTFSPKGRMPMIDVTFNPNERAAMYQYSTYGTGTRPVIRNGVEQTSNTYLRYGRDLDASNNIIGNINCYYSPYPDRPYYLTFRDRTFAEWREGTPWPAGFPGALQPYLTNGQPVPLNLANQYLVPNDSRMYQMKLVLWRLLGEESKSLLSRMHIGMATSYQETNFPTLYGADFYKYDPWDSGTYSNVLSGDYSGTYTSENNISFPHGAGPDWSSGIGTLSGGSGPYNNSSSVYAGIIRDFYVYPIGSSQWVGVNRALLKLPFDYLYKTRDTGEVVSTDNLAEFQLYINGIEKGDGNTYEGYVDPEFIADGKTPLATSIYGRDDHLNGAATRDAGSPGYIHPAIYFGLSPETQMYAYGYIKFKNFLIHDDISGEDLKAGNAVGSVIDFFSPRSQNLAFNSGGGSDTRGYFPVIGSCQNNWLVVFTAGNDSDPGAQTATGADAVRKLYLNTQNIRGRKWDRSDSKWKDNTFAMDHGVRTIVVGFVDETDPSSQKLKNELTAMAQYGVPYTDGTPNPKSKPYFANDVPSLLTSLKSVLMRINADKYASSAPVLQSNVEDNMNALYLPAYKVAVFDQWEGWFQKYEVLSDDLTLLKNRWEFNDRLMSGNLDARQIYTVNSTTDTATTTSLVSTTLLENLAGVPSTDSAKFNKWLHRYHRMSEGLEVAADTVLGDMEHGGFAVVGLASADEYPGITGRTTSSDVRVYLQTNRGVLHAVNDLTGNEEWAFIPPNIFQGRLKDLKYDKSAPDDYLENDGTTHLNSKVLVLLDGPLNAKEVRDGNNYKTALLGNLGWGGNGIYVLDVTSPANQPKFLWAVDNARYGVTEEASPLMDGLRRWGSVAGLSDVKSDYTDLGLTIVSPAILSIDHKGAAPGDVGVLPGGLGYQLGANSQGKVIYVFEPLTGEILNPLGKSATDFITPAGRSLGMMIAPISYVAAKDGNKKLKNIEAFFTADSEGNVLSCDTTGSVNTWKLESVFQLRTADNSKPVFIAQALEYGITSKPPYQKWIFGGTCDLRVPDYTDTRKMENPEQYIFGVNLTSAPRSTVTSDLYQRPYVKDSLPGNPPGAINPGDEPEPTLAQVQNGWALKLRPATDVTKAEYVTVPPFLYLGVLYVATFVPKPIPEEMASRDLCPELGDAKVYALSPFTGKGLWPGRNASDPTRPAVVLEGKKLSGATAKGGNIFFSVQDTSGSGVSGEFNDVYSQEGEKTQLAVGEGVGHIITRVITVSPDIPYLQYWKETY
ncbi:MAG: hypothetical protein LBR61_04560 [Synergistaceae bacterium]|jgi:Tfp pilus tip-associated adhesin PilY1|nr:hypothetical protein [Synergistaceae bacterium]